MGRTMRRLILLQLCLCLFAGVALAEFRGIPWGASMREVIESEGEPIERSADGLVYETEIAGLSANARFHFVGDRLGGGTYDFTEVTAARPYFDDFREIDVFLYKKYRKPTDIFEDGGAEYLYFSTTWVAYDSIISHIFILADDNLKLTHCIEYKPISLGQFEEQKNEAEALKQL